MADELKQLIAKFSFDDAARAPSTWVAAPAAALVAKAKPGVGRNNGVGKVARA